MALATRPKRTSPQHKKRSGQHHRHSKPYLKTYWPYLPMLFIMAIGLAVNSLWSTHSVLGTSSNFTSSALLTSTNAARHADHEAPLTLNSELTAAAQAKASDMVKRDYWAHITPDGRTPWSFITAAGYQYAAAGENLAYGFNNAADTVTAWMNSPEHRANVLNAHYQNIGFGVASSPNYQGKGPETVVVAEYAQPVAAALTAPGQTGSTNAQDPQVDQELAAQSVTRLQLLTGSQATWASMMASALAGAALATFIVRHGLRLKRLAFAGETFVTDHPLLDIVIVFIFTAGFVLTRTSGLIH